MTESIFDSADGTAGGESSAAADVDASYDSAGDSGTASVGDGADAAPADSHSADIDAGYDDESDDSTAGGNGLDLG